MNFRFLCFSFHYRGSGDWEYRGGKIEVTDVVIEALEVAVITESLICFHKMNINHR